MWDDRVLDRFYNLDGETNSSFLKTYEFNGKITQEYAFLKKEVRAEPSRSLLTLVRSPCFLAFKASARTFKLGSTLRTITWLW